MASGNARCILPEGVLVLAKSRGINVRQKLGETMVAYACRIMNVHKRSIRFTLSANLVHAHYIQIFERSSCN